MQDFQSNSYNTPETNAEGVQSPAAFDAGNKATPNNAGNPASSSTDANGTPAATAPEFVAVAPSAGNEASDAGGKALNSTFTTTLKTNTNAYTFEQLTAMCDRLSDRCKQWEDNQQRASNDVLYGLLEDCLNLYKDTQAFKDVRKNFLKLYDSKFAKAKDGTSIMTKIVRITFGTNQKNRNYGYARVLTIADKEMKPAQTLRQFIVSAGGIEEIRRAGTGQSATQRLEAIEAAKNALEDIKALSASIQVDLSSVGSEKNNDHNYRAALIRQAADNTFSVVMVSKREVMVTSLLNEHAKRIASDGANAAPAAPTVDDATARHTAIVNNVLN